MKYINLNDKEKEKIINKLYVKENKSFAIIANELFTYANKVRRDAIKFNIKIRDKSNAQKNAISNGVVDHPTKGKKRSQEVKNKIGLSVMNAWDSMSDSELKSRQEKARQQWIQMDDEKKQNMIKLANDAVRLSSKTGSKLEKYLLEGLINHNIKVDFHKEQNLLNTKLQIDLFLPEINTAIEVDGPSHFLPVWGDDALKKNVKYDNKKNGLLLGKGCTIIRVKQTRDFSPSRAKVILQKILSAIQDIKQKKLVQTKIIEIGDNL